MNRSPPQEAEYIRGKTLTPESPKPVHHPAPSNIPILVEQMDPMFHESAHANGATTAYQPYPQTQTPNTKPTTSLFPDTSAVPAFMRTDAPGNIIPNGYTQSTSYTDGYNAQPQDASIYNYPSQQQYDQNPPAYPAQQTQAQPTQGSHYPSQASNDGGVVNYQALLDSLAAAGNGGAFAAPPMSSQPPQQGQTATSGLPAGPNLPARPPPQDKTATHPHFSSNDDIRSYHPHSQKPTTTQFRAPGQLQPLTIRGNGVNPALEVHSATRSNQSPNSPGYGQRQSVDARSATPDDEDARWPAEINQMYEGFLEDERKYVTDGQWDQFPMGSRLFIGNLPTEKVTKRDIFHRFYRHGKLAQISIKQAYGFVQFLDTASCHKALQAEQGQSVRGRKMHLEISKPQRNTKKADASKDDRSNGARRRSRSPDYTRGGTAAQSRSIDRYTGGQIQSPRDRDNRRYRDEYRRSPSPQRGARGNRGRDRSRDRYDGRDGRRRSRSRSPRRFRSPSPRRDLDEELPLPFRDPELVPDIQVLVVSEGLPRDYIRWVEDSFRQQGLRIDVLILSPRLSEDAVVRRQILEGVLAIVKLDNSTFTKGKINLRLFDRRGGLGNVQFNEYADLDPGTAAALVHNLKLAQSQPAQPAQPAQSPVTQVSYGHNYNAPAAAPAYSNILPSANANAYPNVPGNTATTLSNLLSALDPNGLSQLLGAMSQNKPAPQQPAVAAAGGMPDLARLLESISAAQQPQHQQQIHAQQQQPPQQQQQQLQQQLQQQQAYNPGYPNAFQNASPFTSLFSAPPTTAPPVQTQAQPPPTGQPDMNEIMAQLAKYQR